MPDAAPLDPDTIPFGLLAVGLDGRVQSANRWLAGAVGRPVEEIVGRHVDGLLTGGGRVMYHTYLVPLLRLHGHVQELALPLARADGQVAEVLVYASRELGRATAGTLQVALVPMRERRRIEADLLRVQRAADAAPGVLFECVVHDGRGRVAYASEGIRALFGLGPEAVADDAAPLLTRLHPEDIEPVFESARAALAGGTAWSCEYRARTRDDLPWRWHSLHAICRPLKDGATGWHGFVSDVTERHEMAELQRERDAADRASRAKSEFLARMSHELRTPLNGIIGFAHMLGRDAGGAGNAEQRRRAQIIESSGRQLLALINDVLDISRIESGNLPVAARAVALAPLVARCAAALEPMAAAARVRLRQRCDPAVYVQADADRLAQVLTNLLSNAVKYNRSGGEVEVSADDDGAAAGTVRLLVADTGTGLSPAQLAALFQPFNRLGAEQSRIEGTGLGLVITRQLVERMGGRIDVHSVDGVGSRFTVQLPRAEPSRGAAASLPTAAVEGCAADAGRRRRVLYVEDNSVNVLLMEAMLDGSGSVELATAADGREALSEAAACAPDLMLVDLHLPDMDGVALLARLRALPGMADVPAVAVSADAMPEHIERATAAGFCAYWTKPLDFERVRAEVPRLARLQPAPTAAGPAP